MLVSRRHLIELGLGAAALGASPLHLGFARNANAQEAKPVHGGTLIVGQSGEPVFLTSALQSNNAATLITPKMFDGLLTYDFDFTPKPQLAESWELAKDGLTLTFKMRPNVKWHDGRPLTAEDVEFSYGLWKRFSNRAASLFTSVESVTATDPSTVVWKMSSPAPYLIYAFASHILQVVPKHVYDGTDPLRNPANMRPIGSGPFKFAEWQRGSHLRMVRNEAYWDNPKPYLDEIIFRFMPNASSRAIALETGEVGMVTETNVPGGEIARLAALPNLEVTTKGYDYLGSATYLMFNLDRPLFKDVRVRQAFAHVIDRDFIVNNIWYGYGKPSTGPLPAMLSDFYEPATPQYPLDPEKAKALLDEAGHKPDANGVRFSITHDYIPLSENYQRVGEYLRDALGKIGVRVEVRNQDTAAYVRRIYTSRDFDTANFLMSVGPDPVIGTQRLYWSKTFAPGTPFSNGTNYASPEVDKLLEAAAVEADPAKRRALYSEFQKKIQTDLPHIPLVDVELITITDKRLRDHTVVCEGPKANFADAYLLPAGK